MRAYGASRAELFATVNAPALKPLPAAPYAFAIWKRCRVAPDYHVEIDAGGSYATYWRLELADIISCSSLSASEFIPADIKARR